jgi:ubiquinone biosynthesis protein
LLLEWLWLTLRRQPLDVRQRAAGRRLAQALGSRRGIYTKGGQLLAARADLLPDAVREELASLERSAPARPLADVQGEVERALGPRAGEIAWIEPEPIGTASIAQVHRARLRDGSDLALKVRHPELSPRRVEADVAALGRWLRPAARALGSVDPAPLLADIAEALRDELDFEREGRVAEEIAEVFAQDPRVRVPRVYWPLCGNGVLALEYVSVLPVDDADRLREHGIDPGKIAAVVADAYGRQVFGRGSFHADPHPGNVFVVDEVGHEPQVLFVDFGLSRRLEPELREELRLGLHALLRRDLDALLAGLDRVGALVPGREAEAVRALETALGAGAHHALQADRSGVESLVDLGKRLVRQSGAFRVPRGLLLYARTLAHVLSLTRRIDPDYDAMRQLLPHLFRFLAGS